MTATLTPEQTKLARITGAIGWLFIALACVLPFIAAAAGVGTVYLAGQDVARAVGSLLVLSLIAWAATKNRTALGQANARVVVGLLLCMSIGTHLYDRAKNEELAKDFLRQALAFQEQQASKFNELGERFAAFDFNKVLTPANVATAAGLERAKAQMAQYRGLLRERRSMMQAYLQQADNLINTLPAGETRRAAAAPFEKGKTQTLELLEQLDAKQGAMADATESILQWGGSQAGKLRLDQAGNLVFTTPAQQSQMVTLLAKVQEAEKALQEVGLRAQRFENDAQEALKRHKQDAAEILAK